LVPTRVATLVKSAVLRDARGRVAEILHVREPVELADVGGPDDLWRTVFQAVGVNGLPITLRLEPGWRRKSRATGTADSARA